MIKREPPAPRHSCYRPINTQNKPLTPGDIWQCDECGQHHIWKASDTSTGWWEISNRRVNKELRRLKKGKPFKQSCGHSLGPG